MRRRTILGILSLTLLLGGLALGQEPRPDRQIAITFDDLPFGGPDLGLARIRAENEAILATARQDFERFLAARGYTVAPVTIENSDYIFSRVYNEMKTQGDDPGMRRTADAYLRFTAAQLDFWEGVAQAAVGRPLRHVLLLHDNEIN